MVEFKLTLKAVIVTVLAVMKKEVLIAIIVGFSLGLIITYGIYRAQTSINQAKEDPNEEVALETGDTAHQLTIIQPQDNGIVSDDALEVSGITSKGSMVTIVSGDSQAVVQADELGNFSSTIELTAGLNQLEVTSYSLDGNLVSAQLSVVFSTADLGEENEEDI